MIVKQIMTLLQHFLCSAGRRRRRRRLRRGHEARQRHHGAAVDGAKLSRVPDDRPGPVHQPDPRLEAARPVRDRDHLHQLERPHRLQRPALQVRRPQVA